MFGTPVLPSHADSLTDTDSAISDAPQTPGTPHTPALSDGAGPSSSAQHDSVDRCPRARDPAAFRTSSPPCGRQVAGASTGVLHSYVQLWDTGLRFQPEGDLFYDDSAGVLHAVVGELLYTYAVTSRALQRQPTVVHALGAGHTVQLVGMSQDWRLLALQRSASHVEIMDSSTGNIIIQGPSNKRQVNVVLGFCWVTTPVVDFVLVTAAGLELYQRQEARAGHSLQLVVSKLHAVKWYKYSHETRVMLLSSTGTTSQRKLQGYQFNSRGILKLPSFESACDASPGDVSMVNLYGRVYCCLVDRGRRRLLLYRFYRNTVLLQHQYALYDPEVALSTVDGLLLLHHRTVRVTLVIDVCQPRQGPLGDPLPMTFQGHALLVHKDGAGPGPRAPGGALNRQQKRAEHERPTSQANGAAVDNHNDVVNRRKGGSTDSRPAYVDLGPPGPSAVEASFSNWMPNAATVYSTQWRFEQPNIILDVVQGVVYSVHVDLAALAECASLDLPMLLGVLQRRTHPHNPLMPRTLTIQLLRDALRRQTPLSIMLEAFSVLNSSLKGALQGPQPVPHQANDILQPHMVPGAPVAVMTPQALHNEVLVWCIEQGAVKPHYLSAVLHAYMLSMVASGIPSEPSLSCLLVDTLMRRKEGYQVIQLCGSGCIPPSAQLSEHLLKLQDEGLTMQGRQLALDMLQWQQPGVAQLPPTPDGALHHVLQAASLNGARATNADARALPAQLWLPVRDRSSNLNVPALCAVRRQGVMAGRVPPLPLTDLLLRVSTV